MKILRVLPMIACLLLSCHDSSSDDAGYAPEAVAVIARFPIVYDGFELTPGEVVKFCAIRVRLNDREWEKFKSLKDRQGSLCAKRYHASASPKIRQACYRLEDMPVCFSGEEDKGAQLLEDRQRVTGRAAEANEKKRVSEAVYAQRRLVGYEAGGFYTRHLKVFGKDDVFEMSCHLDISGNEVCELAQHLKGRYHKEDEYNDAYKEAVEFNYDMIAKNSKYQCANKLLAVSVVLKRFPIDLSHFCFYIDDEKQKILCGGKKASEADGMMLNQLNRGRLERIGGMMQSRKLQTIHVRDRDITRGKGALFVMRACLFEEFWKRNHEELDILRYNIMAHEDMLNKCEVSVEHKIIFYGYDQEGYQHAYARVPSVSVMDSADALRAFRYDIDSRLDEGVVQSVNFEKNIVLLLWGAKYDVDGYNIKVYEVCSGEPTIAYLVQDGSLSDMRCGEKWRMPFMLIEVPKGEYQVEFVFKSDAFCGYV